MLILILFLTAQTLVMMSNRKEILDQNKEKLLDSVNAANQVYTNEELSVLVEDLKEDFLKKQEENQTKFQELESKIANQSTLLADLQKKYSDLSTLASTHLKKFVCSLKGNNCSIHFGISSGTAICMIGHAAGGYNIVAVAQGLYVVGWHENDVTSRAIFTNQTSLASVSIPTTGTVQFTISRTDAQASASCFILVQ